LVHPHGCSAPEYGRSVTTPEPTPPLPPPSAATLTPPTVPAGPAKPRRTLWIVLGIVAVVLVAGVGIAIATSSGDATKTLQDLLPKALEDNFASQGVTAKVSGVTCDDIELRDGPFLADCVVSFTGATRTMKAEVSGSIDGNTLRVTSASSPSRLLDAAAAQRATQTVVDGVAQGVKVLECTLPENPLVMRAGDTFTCKADSNETLTLRITDGNGLELANVR
jgi:hypothetical protein